MTTSIVSAVCSRQPMRPFETQYGMRTKAEFTTDGGEVIAVFAQASDTTFASISKGATVELVQGAKGWCVGRVGGQWSHPMPSTVATGGAPFLPAPPRQPGPAAPKPPAFPDAVAVADYVRHHSKVLSFCYREILAVPEFKLLDDESRRSLAVTLYIQTAKKFY